MASKVLSLENCINLAAAVNRSPLVALQAAGILPGNTSPKIRAEFRVLMRRWLALQKNDGGQPASILGSPGRGRATRAKGLTTGRQLDASM